MAGDKITRNTTLNVPDLDAGKKICIASAVYPANSGGDKNLDSNGSGTWRISDSKCYTIAKRPNLQVLGGSLYSSKNLVTSIAVKRNIYDVYPTTLISNANTTIFGSWVEHQVLAVGNTAGLASGASTGYFGSISTRTPKSGLGGSWEGTNVDYCIRVPLTISNTSSVRPCKNSSIAGGYANSTTQTTPVDKEKIIARFTEGADLTGIEYTKTSGDQTIGATTIAKGTTKVIHATGNITITGNITYADGYTDLTQIPKLIIYAEKNITINCNVSRIDAIIIAGKTNGSNGVVDTCPTDLSSQASIDRRDNSNQLKINGTIIANKLTANRTYGAAKGVNSVVPAEIIDYDTTLYLWGMRESEGATSGRLNATYLHEVAPRY